VPVDLVKRLYGEGRGETEVITQLRAQGFTPSQIDKALKAVPKPPSVPRHLEPKEEYRGPLPREVIRPMARAEAPQQKPFLPSPLEGSSIGSNTERISIPEELRPMEIMGPPGGHPQHTEKPKTEARLPAPVSFSAAQAAISTQPGAPKISLEELVEQIVGEQEKKLFTHLDKLQAEHNSNVKRIGDISAKLDLLLVDVRALQKNVDDKSAFANDAAKSLSTKVEALETAFKGLAHVLHKK